MNAYDQAVELAARFRLRKRSRSWAGDCPACAYHDSFWITVSARARYPSLHCASGCSREELGAVAQAALGSAWEPPSAVGEDDALRKREAKQAAAQRLWNGSCPCNGTAAAAYFGARGLTHLVTSPALRFRADCWHPERSTHSALIANVQDAAGRTVGVHRTYLTRDGRKAALDPPKASLGPIWGGAIRLDDAAPEMVVGEGMETAGSAGLILNLPAWAAISAGNMAAAMVLPKEVRRVVVAVDPDPPGRKAAQDAAVRWRAEGRHVRLAVPDRTGVDFNDLLMERQCA